MNFEDVLYNRRIEFRLFISNYLYEDHNITISTVLPGRIQCIKRLFFSKRAFFQTNNIEKIQWKLVRATGINRRQWMKGRDSYNIYVYLGGVYEIVQRVVILSVFNSFDDSTIQRINRHSFILT